MGSSLFQRDRQKRTPVYQRLIGDIRQRIDEGKLKEGMPLASENQLCGSYNISRKSVRAAIGELVEGGLLHRVPGKGTFVGPAASPAAFRKTFMPSNAA